MEKSTGRVRQVLLIFSGDGGGGGTPSIGYAPDMMFVKLFLLRATRLSVLPVSSFSTLLVAMRCGVIGDF